jgi:hypothetical protein
MKAARPWILIRATLQESVYTSGALMAHGAEHIPSRGPTSSEFEFDLLLMYNLSWVQYCSLSNAVVLQFHALLMVAR